MYHYKLRCVGNVNGKAIFSGYTKPKKITVCGKREDVSAYPHREKGEEKETLESVVDCGGNRVKIKQRVELTFREWCHIVKAKKLLTLQIAI